MRLVRGEGEPASDKLSIEGKSYSLAELRSRVLRETPGESIAYLTDFRLDEATEERLTEWLTGCDTLVCESNFRGSDHALAAANYHLTSLEAARLASRIGPRRLVLFHLSDRYTAEDWREQLNEAQAIFPRAEFPRAWKSLAG
jgi:ribonuclease Z